MPKTPDTPRKPGTRKAVAKPTAFARSRIPKSMARGPDTRAIKPMPLHGKSRGR